jgi:hypothetical protein
MLEKLNEKRTRTILVLGILAIMAGLFAVRFRATEAADVAVDFPSFYYASKLTFEDGLTPYNNSNWRLVKPLYTEGELFPFIYSPPSLLVFRLFTFFDYATAKAIMLWTNHALILVFLYIFFIKILGLKLDNLFLIPAIVFLYLFYPLALTLNNGQVGLWVLISICLTWWATKEKWHPVWIALPLVFGIFLKIYPVLLLAVYLIRRDYRTVKYVLALLIAFSAVATLVLPDGIWQDWYVSVASKGYAKEVDGVKAATPANQSLHGFTTRLFFGRNQRFERLLRPPAWADQAPYILAGFVVLASAVATWWIAKRGIGDPDALNIQFCIWILATFLVAPFSWDHHLVHILPAIYLGVVYAYRRKSIALLVLASAIAVFLAVHFPSNDPFFRRGVWTLLISSPLFAVGALWVYFLLLPRSQRLSGIRAVAKISD